MIPGWRRYPEVGNGNPLQYSWTSLVAQTVKCLPTMRETQVQSLGREDLLEKEMATHSSILAWKIPWTMEPGLENSMDRGTWQVAVHVVTNRHNLETEQAHRVNIKTNLISTIQVSRI